MKAVPNGAVTATIINAPIIAEISVIDHPKASIIENISTAGVLPQKRKKHKKKNEINAINH